MAALELSTPPGAEPVLTADAKTHLRVDHADEDAYIDGLIVAARREAERISWRALITQTWKLYLDSFPPSGAAIYLPKPPLQSVGSITYLDTDGVSQTWAAAKYRVDAKSVPARITPAFNETYPSTRNVTGAITITFTAGYGAAGTNVPENIIHWIKLWIGAAYRLRERLTDLPARVMPFAETLLDPVRDDRIAACLMK